MQTQYGLMFLDGWGLTWYIATTNIIRQLYDQMGHFVKDCRKISKAELACHGLDIAVAIGTILCLGEVLPRWSVVECAMNSIKNIS